MRKIFLGFSKNLIGNLFEGHLFHLCDDILNFQANLGQASSLLLNFLLSFGIDDFSVETLP